MSDNKFYIKFFAPVIPETVGALMQIVDNKIKQGLTELGILLSTPGGNVFHGLSAYNYLRGVPIFVTTHNFGSADSVGVVLFCAGEKRYSVPQARFLLHGVSANFNKCSLEEKQLEERLKGLQIDMGNIAHVISDTVGKDKDAVVQDMHERTTLYPQEAVEYGLVHKIKAELFEPGSDVASIQFSPKAASSNQGAGGDFLVTV
jgi:ATP-dependent protease ClpP protease subunit